MLSNEERLSTLRFLGGLRRPDGSYAETQGGPATIQSIVSVAKSAQLFGARLERPDDTFAVLGACRDPATGGFVNPGAERPAVFPTAMAMLALGQLGATSTLAQWLPAAFRFLGEHASAREEHFMVIGVADECRVTAPRPTASIAYFRAMERADGTFGPSVLENAIAASALLRAGEQLKNPEAVVRCLLDGQRPEGGFADTGAPCSLWATYCCMRALDLLGRAPEPARLEHWLRALLRAEGGMGEPGKAATAGATYQVLSVLDWLCAPALRAARAGDTAALARWLAAGGDPDVRSLDGWTPLHAAAVRGRAEAVALLLAPKHPGARPADPEARVTAADALPLFWAGQSGDLATVQRLLEARPRQLLEISRVNGHTVLLQAAFFGSERHRAVAAFLLENVGTILGVAGEAAEARARHELTVATNVRGYNGLTMSRLWGNHPMAALFEAHDRSTAAEREAYHRELLSRIAVPPPADAREREVQRLTDEVIELLQAGLTRVGQLTGAEASEAAEATVREVRRVVGQPGFAIDRQGGPLGETPLIAVITGVDATPEVARLRERLVRELLQRGADPDVPERHPMGVDAVIRAAVLNHFELLELLAEHMKPLAFAAALNEKPAINGQTALQDTVHRALTSSSEALERHVAQLRWMVQRGARSDVADHTGTTPADLARRAADDPTYRDRAGVVLKALEPPTSHRPTERRPQ